MIARRWVVAVVGDDPDVDREMVALRLREYHSRTLVFCASDTPLGLAVQDKCELLDHTAALYTDGLSVAEHLFKVLCGMNKLGYLVAIEVFGARCSTALTLIRQGRESGFQVTVWGMNHTAVAVMTQ